MSNIFEKNKTYILLGVAAIVFLGLYIYLNNKNSKLYYYIDDLKERVNDLEDTLQKYDKLLNNKAVFNKPQIINNIKPGNIPQNFPQNININTTDKPDKPDKPDNPINNVHDDSYNTSTNTQYNSTPNNYDEEYYSYTENDPKKHVSFNTRVEEINEPEEIDEFNLDNEIADELKELEEEDIDLKTEE